MLPASIPSDRIDLPPPDPVGAGGEVGAGSAPGDAADMEQDATVNILLVDDRPENLLSLEAILGPLRQNLVSVTTGADALRALLSDEFAVILLDVNLPGIDGFETAALIRARDRSHHTPIIFLTALDKTDRRVAQGYELGAVDFMFKPFDPDILRTKVSVFIELFRKSHQIRRLNETLERRVAQRTHELQATNQELQNEIAERKRAEAEVRSLNARLEERVQERTAALEAANRDLEAFSYSVSHDLRAPLRRIESFSRILLDDHTGALDPLGRDYLDRIGTASRQMSDLIDDMLRLSRVSREAMTLEHVDLSAMAHDVTAELRAGAPGWPGLLNIEEGIVVRGDPRLLRVALSNLIENAWKFSSKKSCPEIGFGSRQEGEEQVFYVRDNGAGFDMTYAHQLFAPFQRMHAASEFPGTGIGLAIVERVIRRHGGRIWAEADIDAGATFSFTLHTESLEEAAGEPGSAPEAQAG